VAREHGWWVIVIDELDGVTQARRLAQAGERAAGYVAVARGVSAAAVEVRLELCDIGSVTDLDARRARVAAARDEANRLAVALARDLVAEGVPLPDVATVVGVALGEPARLRLSAASGE
jgi:hypothetical protein